MKLAGRLAGRVSLACGVILVAMAASLTASQLRLPPRASHAATPVLGTSPNVPDALRVSAPGPSLWDKRWWIDKTARLLRAGEGLGPDDDIDALLRMSEEEVARHFMSDARFGDAVLDFNMYFLGFKSDELKTDGNYNSNAFDFANAVAASQALLRDGDYFRLFDLEGDFSFHPDRVPQLQSIPAVAVPMIEKAVVGMIVPMIERTGSAVAKYLDESR